jgi:hypothetical protein
LEIALVRMFIKNETTPRISNESTRLRAPMPTPWEQTRCNISIMPRKIRVSLPSTAKWLL